METSFADRMNIAMRKENMSISDTAKKTGIGKGLISYYANGKAIPKIDKISSIAQALNVPVEWLVSGENRNTELGDYNLNRNHLESVDPGLIPYLDELSDPKNKKRILFDKVKDLEPDDVESLLRVIRMFEEGK